MGRYGYFLELSHIEKILFERKRIVYYEVVHPMNIKLENCPINGEKVSIGFQGVCDFFSNSMIQPQLLKLVVSLRTQIQRVTSPKQNSNHTIIDLGNTYS